MEPEEPELIWALFWAQCDWAVVHLAKTCGSTSLAFTDLLAIPEMCLTFTYHYDYGANILR